MVKSRKNRKNRKGGLILTDSKHRAPIFECNSWFCVPAVLFELGLADEDTAKYISSFYTHGGGLNILDVQTLINEAYGVTCYHTEYVLSPTTYRTLFEKLEENEAVIATIPHIHMFYIYKQSGVLLARDPQSSSVTRLVDYLHGSKKFLVIFTHENIKIPDQTFQITTQLFDRLIAEKKITIVPLSAEQAEERVVRHQQEQQNIHDLAQMFMRKIRK
jgi:hypothetical protein